MPYQVQQIIQGKSKPVCIRKEDSIPAALSLMVEHDYSQLPVTRQQAGKDIPEGMVTYEAILRGVRNFHARLEDLKVRDVMVAAPIHNLEDDLFDILDRLKDTYAVLITTGDGPDLVGIVTSYDSTEYFRSRTEDLMRVEDVELMIKDFIKAAYLKDDGEIDQPHLEAAIHRVTNTRPNAPEGERKKGFEELTLSEYISLLLLKDTWTFFDAIFKIPREAVNQLLNGVREVRNALAHFRKEISPDERDKLRFAADWLSRCQEEYLAQRPAHKDEAAALPADPDPARLSASFGVSLPNLIKALSQNRQAEGAVSEENAIYLDYSNPEVGGSTSRYAAFSDWLQSVPGSVNTVQLTFAQIEEMIKAELPPSARQHRAWWANDTSAESRAQLWLDAGWRTTSVNLNQAKVTFSRIREREKAYIAFFSQLLDELRKKADFPIKDVSPGGTSWIVVQQLPHTGSASGLFAFSFSRDKRLRVELYLDLGDQTRTKAAFDRLFAQKDTLQSQAGPLEWERLDARRASRIAAYHAGQVTDDKEHPALRKWAVETMNKFYQALEGPAGKAIEEAKGGGS